LSAFAVCFNAFASLALLFPASIMAGVAFGALWSLMATLTSEFFGLHHFASNYTFIQVCLLGKMALLTWKNVSVSCI